MRKGITPIIAEIMLLLMTVALAGSAWLFFSGQLNSMTGKVIAAEPLSNTENSVLVTNLGTQTINANEIIVSVDGRDALIVNPQQMMPGKNAVLYYIPGTLIAPDVWEFGPFNSTAEIRVRGPSNVVKYGTFFGIGSVGNLVRNPGIEQGVNVGWLPISPFIANETTDVFRGSNSISITGDPTTWTALSSDYIPYDSSMRLNIELYAKSVGAGGLSTLYAGFAEYDKDKNFIEHWYVYYYDNTRTTLAADLNPGDTQFQLTSGANWLDNTQLWYFRVIGFWNTGDYPPYTYTRNIRFFRDAGGNTVTLCDYGCTAVAPWTGPVIPAGTPVANMYAGSGFNYIAATGANVPTTWTRYSGSVTGWNYGQTENYSIARYGTKYVRVLLLPNYAQDSSYRMLLDEFRIWEG